MSELSSLFEPYVWAWFCSTYHQPSPPQSASWPRIAQGRNTLIFAPTGSGKTLAAFLWCLNLLYKLGSQGLLEDTTYVLYVSPLKALNNDIHRNLVEPLQGIRAYAERLGVPLPEVRAEVRTGDTTSQKRSAMARKPPHILITTPESLYIILATAKFREALRSVRYVIVDEIHALSDNKRGVHLSLSLERLQRLVPHPLVRIGLSATQSPLEEIAQFLAGQDETGRPRPCEIVDVGARKGLDVQVVAPVDNLLEAHFDAIWSAAYGYLLDLIRGHVTTLVFMNSRYKTERTALKLNDLAAEERIAVGAHHGSMSKSVRLDMENRLKQGQLRALVATSSLELGIDVGSIDLVCQVESPKSVSTGLQRIGRAGHLLNATSQGRLLVMDRDDLVEAVVLVRGMLDGEIDTTRIPHNCLDVLAQQIVGAVAADPWRVDDLYALCRRSYCYHDLSREDFGRVLDMLAGNYGFRVDHPPYPKIAWDKVNDVLTPERSARLIAFRSGGTIPDIADYDVYLDERKTVVGKLDEGFVEELEVGDVFVLGSSAWRVLGFERNRVRVKDVYGQAPTIPFWLGERSSRTYDLGLAVGRFRREAGARLDRPDFVPWLQRTYAVDENGARSLYEYLREQRHVTGELPSDQLWLVEHFRNELGQTQIVLHVSYGIRVHDAWALALCQAIEERFGFRPQSATVDDGILITVPTGPAFDPVAVLDLVMPDNLDALLDTALRDAAVFAARFRHNAVRSLMVLREYHGQHTPVWLQSLRAADLLEACRDDPTCPLIVETRRECLHEALDVPALRDVLLRRAAGEIRARIIETSVPSPFTHALLLLGQYGEAGVIPARERRTRLIHLHRELLKQILDEETLRNLLDEEVVGQVEGRLQYTHHQRRARDAHELARALLDLGDLPGAWDDVGALVERTARRDGDLPPGPVGAYSGRNPEAAVREMLSELVAAHRALLVSVPTVETNPERWISTENLALYHAAFALDMPLDEADRRAVRLLVDRGPLSAGALALHDDADVRLGRLLRSYAVLRLPGEAEPLYVAAEAWVPATLRVPSLTREEARRVLTARYLRTHGPITKYEIMEAYGFPEALVERVLAQLHAEGEIARGEYVPYKAFPQWCHKGNLEEIHRLTLKRMQREMEPAAPEEYADFLLRWQHVHPATRLTGLDGLRQVLAQVQGSENYQAVFERDLFPARVEDYVPALLDRLCYSGEVLWRRFDAQTLRRGRIGFCFRRDRDWLVPDPAGGSMNPRQWDDDIPAVCDAVRAYLAQHGPSFFDDILAAAGFPEGLVLRAVWHLVWTGEASNDSYASIRHAHIQSGLSGCYDLATRPTKRGATLDLIVRHMQSRSLDPRLGRWVPSERLVPASLAAPPRDEALQRWAALLLQRHGVVCRDVLALEACAPVWKDLRRALVRMELLGQVRRGFFVQDLSGEQYALPEAVEALRAAKLRQPEPEEFTSPPSPLHPGEGSRAGTRTFPLQDGAGLGVRSDEAMLLVNACDPANPFGTLFPLANGAEEQVRALRQPGAYLILQGGQPIAFYDGYIKLLQDLSLPRAEAALRALVGLLERPDYGAGHLAPAGVPSRVHIHSWNEHPSDVSPARHLLTRLGFVPSPNPWLRYVYDGVHFPDQTARAEAEQQMPVLFERVGKERAPVRYDADWVVSRANPAIQPKLRELLSFLEGALPPECALRYGGRGFGATYRGVRCISTWLQQKQVILMVSERGWAPGLTIGPETDLRAPDFAAEVQRRLDKARRNIDEKLDSPRRP